MADHGAGENAFPPAAATADCSTTKNPDYGGSSSSSSTPSLKKSEKYPDKSMAPILIY